MRSGSYLPGDLAVWHSGSSMMSWPPDGWATQTRGCNPKTNTIVLVIGVTDHHGSIVMTPDNHVWWCPQAALRGEPSASIIIQLSRSCP